jgi:hypothetical protein
MGRASAVSNVGLDGFRAIRRRYQAWSVMYAPVFIVTSPV